MENKKYVLKRECKGVPAGAIGTYNEEHDGFIFKHGDKKLIVSSYEEGERSALSMAQYSGFIVREYREDIDGKA